MRTSNLVLAYTLRTLVSLSSSFNTMELSSQSAAVAAPAVNDGNAATDPGLPSTVDAPGTDAAKSNYPAILDGTFFRVVSVGDDGNSVKAACINLC